MKLGSIEAGNNTTTFFSSLRLSDIWIEVHVLPEYAQASIKRETAKKSDLYPIAYEVVQKAAGLNITLVDWKKVKEAVFLSRGIPTEIMLSDK